MSIFSDVGNALDQANTWLQNTGKSISGIGNSLTGIGSQVKTGITNLANQAGEAAGKSFFQKNKVWIVGGAVLLGVLVFMRRK